MHPGGDGCILGVTVASWGLRLHPGGNVSNAYTWPLNKLLNLEKQPMAVVLGLGTFPPFPTPVPCVFFSKRLDGGMCSSDVYIYISHVHKIYVSAFAHNACTYAFSANTICAYTYRYMRIHTHIHRHTLHLG